MILLYLIYIAIIVFSVRTVVFLIGATIERRKAAKDLPDYTPFVSVIVPARNEENHIRQTVESIFASDYPADKYELIVIDDRSGDATPGILEELKKSVSNLNVLTITDDSQKNNLKGKPGALNAGILKSRGEIIVMTDADCTVHKSWLRAMVATYSNPNVGLTASCTNVKGERVFDRIQAVEWIYLVTMASAGIGLKMPLGCYGNNYSIRRSDYDAVGGYSNIKFSVTEDLALLQAVHNHGRDVRYLIDHRSVVHTLGVPDFSAYLNQHHRWAIGGLELGWKAFVFIVSSVALWTGIAASLLSANFLLCLWLFIGRLLMDSILILPTILKIKDYKLIKWLPLSAVCFSLAELIVPVLLLKKKVVWKGQVFR